MIKINRTTRPAMLYSSGANAGKHKFDVQTDVLKNEYQAHSADYNSGAKNFTFDSSLYGDKLIKDGLKKMQHKKCCFCESKVTAIAHGDVEHFRPKGGFQIKATDPIQKPGYYWLAYDWDNLFFTCQICNQSYKKNLFPLLDEGQRAKNHLGNPSLEKPYLIDPAKENPEHFIKFNKEVAVGMDAKKRGEKTIEVTGLNRPDLQERRLDYFELIKNTRLIAGLPAPVPGISQTDINKAKALLVKFKSAESKYTAMIRSNY